MCIYVAGLIALVVFVRNARGFFAVLFGPDRTLRAIVLASLLAYILFLGYLSTFAWWLICFVAMLYVAVRIAQVTSAFMGLLFLMMMLLVISEHAR
jgi:hypothetical protein